MNTKKIIAIKNLFFCFLNDTMLIKQINYDQDKKTTFYFRRIYFRKIT